MWSQNSKDLYEAVCIKSEHFERFGRLCTSVETRLYQRVHGSGNPKACYNSKITKKRRPAGSKNKKTFEKETAIEAMILSGIDP